MGAHAAVSANGQRTCRIRRCEQWLAAGAEFTRQRSAKGAASGSTHPSRQSPFRGFQESSGPSSSISSISSSSSSSSSASEVSTSGRVHFARANLVSQRVRFSMASSSQSPS